ncbi:MAG: CHASE domain-containing protein [Methyloversatilis discipulorum]|nr:CHASE domain-containing protein [Methyloversatilis discipulorum]
MRSDGPQARSATMASTDASLRHRLNIPDWLSWLALSLGLLVTAAVSTLLWDRLNAATAQRFESEVDKVVAQLRRRMVAHEEILRGAAGLVRGSREVTRDEWHDYVNELDLERNFPGILGVGLTVRIPAADKAAHEAAFRRQMPDYAIYPATPRAEFHSILFLEPLNERNRKAIGFDMNSEPTRSAAMSRARDSGEAALSGRVVLVQEGKDDVQPGFLLYYPVYSRELVSRAANVSVEARRRALLGYAYSPYRAHDLFGSALRGYAEQVVVAIHDGRGVEAETLLYSNARGDQKLSGLEDVREIEVAGHVWTVRTCAPAGFGADHLVLWLVPLMGVALSAVLFHLLRVLAETARAHRDARATARELTLSETRLSAVLDTAADGIVTTDEGGMVLTMNRSAADMFDRRADEVIGLPLARLLPQFDADWFAAGLRDAHHAERVARHESSTGLRGGVRQFPVTVSASRFVHEGRVVHTLLLRDVSEQLAAQTRMRLHDRALASSSEAVLIRDVQRDGLPVVYVNAAFERMTGRSAQEVVGRPFSYAADGEAADRVGDEMRWAIAHAKPFSTTVEVRRADGRSMWAALSSSPVRDNDGEVTHYVDVFDDITERVEFEQKLIRRTNRLHTVFALSPDGFVTFDGSGILTNVNPAFVRMTHLAQSELLGIDAQTFDRRMAALSDPTQPWPELALDGSSEDAQRLWLLHPERRVLERSARVAPQGRSETVLYFRDITQQFEVDRMKSEFLSTAAHELRTPLSSIFGFAELLLNREYDEVARRRMHGIIHRQSRVLVNLINDLLDLARIEARAGQDFRYEDLPVKMLINATLEGLAMPGDTHRVSLDMPQSMPRIRVDHEKMVRALSNIITNAFKYSPDGGEVRLSVTEVTRNSRLMAGIHVSDEGIGMTPEQQARIFERFYRADPSGNIPGTGLGMSLVKEIMDLHGGEIEIVSAPGAGTTVTLWLPVMDTATT